MISSDRTVPIPPVLRSLAIRGVGAMAISAAVFGSVVQAQTPAQSEAGAMLVAPGVVSTDTVEYGITFTPDGGTAFFTRRPSPWGVQPEASNVIYVTHREGADWSQPRVAPFSGIYDDRDPFVSPDGKEFFFVSNRPHQDGGALRDDRDIWTMSWNDGAWSRPRRLGEPINSPGGEYSPVTSADGTLYFASAREGGLGFGDLYMSPRDGDSYREVIRLNQPVNSEWGEWSVGVDPLGRYLIFDASQRRENMSPHSDLYLSHRQSDGSWGIPMNIGGLNTTGSNLLPRFSPDGQSLYFGSADRLYSRDADILMAPLARVLAAHRDPTVNPDVLLVVNRSDHSVSMIDPITFTTLGSMPVGRGPHELAASTGVGKAFVANYGTWPNKTLGEPVSGPRWRTEQSSEVSILDVERRAVVATHRLFECEKPHGIASPSDGSRYWVTCEDRSAVVEVDASTGRPLRRWPTGQSGSHILRHDPIHGMLWVANMGSGSVTAIDLATNGTVVIPTAAGAEGMALSPDGAVLWVLNGRENSVSVIDRAAREVLTTFPSNGAFPVKVVFTPDGSEAWIVHNRSNEVSVFDAQSFALLHEIPLDTTPLGLLMAPDGSRAYVTTPRVDAVRVYDVNTRQHLGTIQSGLEPDGMALMPLRNASDQ